MATNTRVDAGAASATDTSPLSEFRASLDPATSKILIIGAGVFGLSTAYHLQENGFKNIVVLDKAVELPARDAASTDINKVVRSVYGDKFYTQLAREAIALWKDPMWEGCYHESGVITLGDGYVQSSYENDVTAGSKVLALPDAESIRSAFPTSLQATTTAIPAGAQTDAARGDVLGVFTTHKGSMNYDGGWVEAARAITIAIDIVVSRGAKVEGGKEVVTLLKSARADGPGYTHGVKCSDGSTYFADRVIIATGAWTASNFPELELDKMCLATGQTLAMIQLSPEEAEQYRGFPVVLDFSTGFYVLPPNQNNIVKAAVNCAGYTHMAVPPSSTNENPDLPPRKISTPRTILSHPEGSDGLRVPRSALELIRGHLGITYPELAKKPWAATRLCWYTDSPDSDWVIGELPGDPGLFLATSGSGHAFKFLPNVGRIVLDILQDKADAAVVAKFAVNRDVHNATQAERMEHIPPEELVLENLCGAEDLQADAV